jgi:hypothetical protein
MFGLVATIRSFVALVKDYQLYGSGLNSQLVQIIRFLNYSFWRSLVTCDVSVGDASFVRLLFSKLERFTHTHTHPHPHPHDRTREWMVVRAGGGVRINTQTKSNCSNHKKVNAKFICWFQESWFFCDQSAKNRIMALLSNEVESRTTFEWSPWI